jgi:hypothetical protein
LPGWGVRNVLRLVPRAQVMLAIRDGKWKAMDHAHD